MPSLVRAPIELTADERAALESWTRRRSSAQALALRARIVLESATGAANTEVAARLGVTVQTVGKWRARFVARRGRVLSVRSPVPWTVALAQVAPAAAAISP